MKFRWVSSFYGCELAHDGLLAKVRIFGVSACATWEIWSGTALLSAGVGEDAASCVQAVHELLMCRRRKIRSN